MRILIGLMFGFLLILIIQGCHQHSLHTVTVKEFAEFVNETDYLTDAEKFGWSIVQINVFDFEVRDSIDWRNPDGTARARDDFPVTQVSYNDALEYVEWKGAKIPTYDEYWKLVENDTRIINESSSGILPCDQVNLVGNVWEITQPDSFGRIRLAGGSFLCDQNTCNGTNRDRELYVDAATGNIHISFAIIQ